MGAANKLKRQYNWKITMKILQFRKRQLPQKNKYKFLSKSTIILSS